MARLLWLADVLRGAGLTVVEVPGWQTRSAAEDPGGANYGPVRGAIIHETRSPRIASDAAEIDILVNGRVGLSGPIAQLYLGRDGTWHVVASGTCHHVRTGWGGYHRGYGNDRLLGIEPAHTVSVDASGKRLETWAQKPQQYTSYVRGVAAIVKHTGWPVSAVVGHKEHQPGDKPDPEFDMGKFRADVQAATAGTFPPLQEVPDMLVLFTDEGKKWVGDGVTRRQLTDAEASDLQHIASKGALKLTVWADMAEVANPGAFGAVPVVPEAVLSEAQVEKIAAQLIAATDNPLGEADQPAIVAALKQALREGAEG